MSQRVECPRCMAGIKVSDNFPAGRRIHCPKCKEAFAPIPFKKGALTTDDEASSVSERSVAVAARPKRSRRDKPKERASRSAVLFWIALGVGGTISVVAIVTAVMAFVNRS